MSEYRHYEIVGAVSELRQKVERNTAEVLRAIERHGYSTSSLDETMRSFRIEVSGEFASVQEELTAICERLTAIESLIKREPTQ